MSKLKVRAAISNEMQLISWACKLLVRDKDHLRLKRQFLENQFSKKEFRNHI
jgi:hypothetical protein